MHTHTHTQLYIELHERYKSIPMQLSFHNPIKMHKRMNFSQRENAIVQ